MTQRSLAGAAVGGQTGTREDIRHAHPSDLRNVAIVAHVDHGKTTLVDAMLKQSGGWHSRAEMADRVMDSGDLEREKGITILAKNTSVSYHPSDGSEPVTINIIDTPGHADFGGEVERGLTMADGVVLLVDASEGPLPQTRFVLRKALKARMPIILVINKVDRSDARIKEVVDDTYELFLDLDADEHQIDFPIVYACARDGIATLKQPDDGTVPADSTSLEPLFQTILDTMPAPTYTEDAPLQAHVVNLDASPFLGRLALCRVHEGTINKGQTVTWCKTDGTTERVRISELLMTDGLERKSAEQAGPGDIIAVAGINDIMIGETLADAENPMPLPLIKVDEPAISMTIGTNTVAVRRQGQGLEGHRAAGQGPPRPRARRQRVAADPADRAPGRLGGAGPWRAGAGDPGRADAPGGLRADRRQAAGGHAGDRRQDLRAGGADDDRRAGGVPRRDHPAARRPQGPDGADGQPRHRLDPDGVAGPGTCADRLPDRVPDRHPRHRHPAPRLRVVRAVVRRAAYAHNGSLVADRAGPVTAFAMTNLQERGTLFVEPTTEVYEGMIVGENSRSDDMDVNITKEKKLTNMRQSTSDETEKLIPPRKLSLEQSLEFCREDECVEVTPQPYASARSSSTRPSATAHSAGPSGPEPRIVPGDPEVLTTPALIGLADELAAFPALVSVWCGPVPLLRLAALVAGRPARQPAGPATRPPRPAGGRAAAAYTRLADARHYAASMMKVPILAAMYRLADAGALDLDEPIAVVNDFASAHAGAPNFAVDPTYDQDDEVWARLDGDATPRWLGRRMIVRSSNLATNLILARVGIAAVGEVLRDVGMDDSRVERGIADTAGRMAGFDNLTSARDLAALFAAIAAGTKSDDHTYLPVAAPAVVPRDDRCAVRPAAPRRPGGRDSRPAPAWRTRTAGSPTYAIRPASCSRTTRRRTCLRSARPQRTRERNTTATHES